MEAQNGAEVRRVHIVYFLSRNGRIEHPHLIRVHHHSRNGVRLRDVKRWLSELRGVVIPESFAWSYKRRYKTGYVWQDLLDDDLITPISDNEYVLKGSEISSTNVKEISTEEKGKPSRQQQQPSLQQDDHHHHHQTKEENQSRSSSDQTTKSPSEIEQESPSFGSSSSSTLTDDSDTTTNHKSSSASSAAAAGGGASSSFYSTLLTKKRSKNSAAAIDDKKKTNVASADACKNPTTEDEGKKGKSSSSSASRMLKNLMSCGDVETKDSTVAAAAVKKPFMSMCAAEAGHVTSSTLCRRETFGGSQRVFGNPAWVQQQFGTRMSFEGIEGMLKNKSKSGEQKAPNGGAYKPVNGPSCSHCGKQFKPEKMQSHMKSCKGLKSLSSKPFSGHLFTH